MTETASATIVATQIGPGSYRYDLTLTDTGTTTLGTFWFAWVPGADFLKTPPLSVAAPAGWTGTVTHESVTDGYGIQWHVATAPTSELAAGGTLSGFSFTSTDTPAEVFGTATNAPGTAVTTSVVYSGQPFSDLGSELVAAPPCFRAGTRIRTVRGEAAVEQLRVGDRVVTARDGRAATVRWLGHRRVDCRRHPRPADVWPVRIGAEAFGAGEPSADLFLSPDHAVFVGGMLIPVRYLLNGRTVQQEPAETVTYWHVELDRHDAILAEGLACESHLDTGNRAAFANGGGPVQAHPDFARRVWDGEAAAPLACEGVTVTTARRRLLARAASLGHARTSDPGLLVTAGGATLRPRQSGRTFCLTLPPGTHEFRLVSRVWSPAHMRPDAIDTRSLGVAIGRLWLDGRAVALDSPGLAAGWHAPEPRWRWTDGDA